MNVSHRLYSTGFIWNIFYSQQLQSFSDLFVFNLLWHNIKFVCFQFTMTQLQIWLFSFYCETTSNLFVFILLWHNIKFVDFQFTVSGAGQTKLEEDYCDEKSNPCQHGIIDDFKLMMRMRMRMMVMMMFMMWHNIKFVCFHFIVTTSNLFVFNLLWHHIKFVCFHFIVIHTFKGNCRLSIVVFSLA